MNYKLFEELYEKYKGKDVCDIAEELIVSKVGKPFNEIDTYDYAEYGGMVDILRHIRFEELFEQEIKED